MRRPALSIALILLIAACSDDASTITTAPATSSTVPTTTTTTEPPTTTTTEPPTTTTTTLDPAVVDAQLFESDKLLIRRLFGDYSDSWYGGRDSAVRFNVDNNHPDLGFGFDDYVCFIVSPGYSEEIIVDMGSIVRSDGWVLPGLAEGPASRIDGEVPRGRLYAVQIDWVSYEEGFDPLTGADEVHAAILGEGDFVGAYFFSFPPACE